MPDIKMLRDTLIGGKHRPTGSVVKNVSEKDAKHLIALKKAVPHGGDKTPKVENRESEISAETRELVGIALLELNPADDAHWNKAGQPNVNVLKEATGAKLTRDMVDAIAPDFKRPEIKE